MGAWTRKSYPAMLVCRHKCVKIKSKEVEIDGACSMNGGNEMSTVFCLENLKGRSHSEYLGVNGRTISKWIFLEIGWEFVIRIHLAQDRV
jgi:hypothetical protein